jgi:hypothetical protein
LDDEAESCGVESAISDSDERLSPANCWWEKQKLLIFGPVSDPELVVGTIDKDLICSVCFALLTKPTGHFLSFLAFRSLLFRVYYPRFL